MDEKRSRVINAQYLKVVGAFSKDPLVSQGQGVGFGVGALKVRKKIFAMVASRGQFVVRLPKERAAGLVAKSRAKFFEPRPGMKMKEWVVVPLGSRAWVDLAKEAYRH